MKVIREIGITILIAIVIFVSIKTTVQGYEVQHFCMLPNIEDGEFIIVNKANYFFSNPEAGEVIVFWPPEEVRSEVPFIKRVISLPGETVEVKDNKVFINGMPVEEEYIKEPPHYTMQPKKIPPNEYFVLGDNRNSSNDSHYWGTVPRDNIIGKAWFVYWPPERWGLVQHYSYLELAGAN